MPMRASGKSQPTERRQKSPIHKSQGAGNERSRRTKETKGRGVDGTKVDGPGTANHVVNKVEHPPDRYGAHGDNAETHTITIDNVPSVAFTSNAKRARFQSLLKKFGPVSTIAFRKFALNVKANASGKGTNSRRVAARSKNFDRTRPITAFVTFGAPESKLELGALHGQEFEGRHLLVRKPIRDSQTKRTLFFGNIPFGATEEELYRALVGVVDEAQDISNLYIPKDPLGRSKGVAYVEFRKREQARQVRMEQDIVVNATTLTVSTCSRPKDERAPNKPDAYQGLHSNSTEAEKLTRGLKKKMRRKRKVNPVVESYHRKSAKLDRKKASLG